MPVGTKLSADKINIYIDNDTSIIFSSLPRSFKCGRFHLKSTADIFRFFASRWVVWYALELISQFANIFHELKKVRFSSMEHNDHLLMTIFVTWVPSRYFQDIIEAWCPLIHIVKPWSIFQRQCVQSLWCYSTKISKICKTMNNNHIIS